MSKLARDFIEAVIPGDLWETTLDWVRNRLSPGDLFNQDELIEAIRHSRLRPDDIFSDDELDAWALDHEYIKVE